MLVTTWYNVFKAQSLPHGQLHLWRMWLLKLSLCHRTRRIPQFHLRISLHQFLLISTTWRCFLTCEFWHECFWIIFGPGFDCVPCGGNAFKFELGSRLKLWNYNRLFESNSCCTTFVKWVDITRLQQDQSPICFLFAHHIQWHHFWTITHLFSN